MIIERFASYTDDSTLDLPLRRLGPRFLGSLDSFLEGIERDFPIELADVVGRLTEYMRNEIVGEGAAHSAPIRPAEVDSWVFEERFPEAYVAHGELVCNLLGVDADALLHAESANLSQRRFIRARYVPKYLMLLALSAVIGRDRAMAWMKAYLDAAIEDLPIPEDAPDALEELRVRQTEFNLVEQGMDWIQAVLGPHQYLNKVIRCRIHVVLSSYDAELMDVVACYPDFAMFRHTNPHFILTRTSTLMSGGSCCDTCYHDDRHVESFIHPSATFVELR